VEDVLSKRGVQSWGKTGILRPGRAEISADGLIVGGHFIPLFLNLCIVFLASDLSIPLYLLDVYIQP